MNPLDNLSALSDEELVRAAERDPALALRDQVVARTARMKQGHYDRMCHLMSLAQSHSLRLPEPRDML